MLITLFTSMMTARIGPRDPPRSIAARKIRILAQKPPVGGMPAREIMNTVIPTASSAERRARPAKSVISSRGDERLTATATAYAPTVMIP